LHERQQCTLHELETVYSLPDLAKFHMGLDIVDELATKVHAENKRRAEAQRKN